VRALLGALEEQGLLTAEALGRMAQQLSELVGSREGDRYVIGRAADGSIPFADFGDLQELGLAKWLPKIVTALGGGGRAAETYVVGAVAGGAEVPVTVSSAVSITSEEWYPLHTPVTINGVVLAPFSAIGIVFYREPAALLGRADGAPGLAPVPVTPGSKHLFDRRFIVTVPSDVPVSTELRPFGQLLPRDIAASTLARARVSTLPCLAKGAAVTHLPAQAVGAVREAWGGWKRGGEVLPALADEGATFDAKSLLAERFANEVIRY
jgi:hypothetical protein